MNLKNLFRRPPKIEVGQKIEIISWSRSDGADAYAGSVGIVTDVDYEVTGVRGLKGWLCIKLESGATLSGIGLNKLKYKIHAS